MLSRNELAAWLRLATTPGIGRASARKLLAALGSAERVLAADPTTLLALTGPDIVGLLKRRDAQADDRLATTQRWLDTATPDLPRDIVTLDDPRYPALLLETGDPPLLLFTLGRVELLSSTSIAIVGSRRATPQGRDNARAFARGLSGAGLTVVSGLATGIDAAAHQGGLEGRGNTVAFIGTGLDRVYPAPHAGLMRQIVEQQGLVASEYALGTPPRAENFPRRNRLIAGISLGTLVVEAALESGSLITARLAVESGRDVFAIPGSIHSPQSQGCHRLIQDGAKLVECADDVLRELRLGAPGDPRRAAMAAPQASLFDAMAEDTAGTGTGGSLRAALGHDPVSFDALAARTGLPSEQLAARLLELELAGTVERLPGGLLQQRGRA